MADFARYSVRRSRRRRCCQECHAGIEAGDRYVRGFGVYDGNIFASRMCRDCGDLLSQYDAQAHRESPRWEPVEWQAGDLFSEILRFLGQEYPARMTRLQLRDWLSTQILERRERFLANRHRAERDRAARVASARMVQGMSEAGRV